MNIIKYASSIANLMKTLDREYREYMNKVDEMRSRLHRGDINGVHGILYEI